MGRVADLSTLLIYGAIAALVVAMIAFAIDASGKIHRSDSAVRRPAANAGIMVTWLATVFLLLGVITRGIAQRHVPWSNMYEFTVLFTLMGLVIYLVLNARGDLRAIGLFVTIPAVSLLGIAVVLLYSAADGVAPILDHYWLVIHVPLAIGAVAVSSVAAALATLQLAKDYTSASSSRLGKLLRPLPTPAALERLAHRFTAVGFVLWTFTLIAGAIWANSAWTRAWGWDAKEVWTLVIWVIYAAYLHARATRGWDGKRSAYLILLGFLAILINLFVVNYFFDSKHSYALTTHALQVLMS
ncbi:MAG: c-type cytochrome biogenesis protein CcsB [Bowdeniella nasicola]|nr:c-type cytochrome biogenesis protein CcsB [Bowdeniella nasicola]